MKRWRKVSAGSSILAMGLATAASVAACGAVRAEGATATATATIAASLTASGTAAPGYTAADVRFMQDMMVHHAQAVEMTELVAERTDRADIVLLARRIAVAQEDEMAQMRRWLEARGEPVPDDHAHHGHDAHHGAHAGMPGMLTPAEMARLEAARGAAFDRLFLESMIRHHEGALVMVEQLFAVDGAGQEPEIFQFATHVDSDQRIEIARMRALLTPQP